ncbi:MAG: GIY-YIG nuclease family protein [Candidatus Levybacteria bacterium]|nr:GIY-YIG nuclease family protein [Candidatus Levybacteria bacterium]
MVFVYILQSLKDKGYYIGISSNLDKRLDKHNNGGVYSTKNRKPFKIIYSEKYKNYLSARIREKEIKSFKGGIKFKSLIGVYCCGIV